MKTHLPGFFLLFFLVSGSAGVAQAQDSKKKPDSVQLESVSPFSTKGPSTDPWQGVRDKQPAGLHLTLTLPKTSYYLGEIISAKLVFSNETKDPYHMWMGTYDRSGRIPDISFKAEGEDGAEVGDPLKWYLAHFGFFGGGIGNFTNLGTWGIELPANQWLKFEKPGVYKLYARSTRVQPGDKDAPRDGVRPPVELVSDPATITIVPLPADEEKAIIAQAKKDMDTTHQMGRDKVARAAAERLRYLQTPAACDALLQLFDTPYSTEAMMGLCSTMEPPALTEKILAGVKEMKLGLSDPLLQFYSSLKNGGSLYVVKPGGGTSADDLRLELDNAAKSGITEDGSGDVFFSNLVTLFCNDPHEPKLRAIMIKRQLDLPQKQIDDLLRDDRNPFKKKSAAITDKDFLPLLREQVKPEIHNPYALAALVAVAPDEARPIIIEDIKRDHPIYIPTDHVFRPDMDLFAHVSLPEREMPALDPILREKLPRKTYGQDDLETTMILIERYATKALLPEVVALYKADEGRWQCVLQASALRYWIRCDPNIGVQALGDVLKRDGKTDTGCFRIVLTDVLQKAWVEQALPLVLSATSNENLDVVRSAAGLLEAHAGPEAIDNVIAAIERISALPVPEKGNERLRLLYEPRGLTELLLGSKRWMLSRAQLERLEKVAADKNLKERLAARIAEMK
ncbi:MAG: hypothetical protein WCD79_20065 [Chthoniobacteraceae bacterium]